VVRKGWRFVRRAGAAGIAATAVTVAMCSQTVLMIFDPHLTYRGSGDAFFLILALMRTLARSQKSAGGGQEPAANAVTGTPEWRMPAGAGAGAGTMVGR
jgi:hypothetical protein